MYNRAVDSKPNCKHFNFHFSLKTLVISHAWIYSEKKKKTHAHYYQELVLQGASNYHTLVGPILCQIWRLGNVPCKVAACLHLLH